jgi:MinD superfamily P-loop ATPase
MTHLVILSGKGGTGKTTVAAALAHLASQELPVVLADADVDASNLELLLNPKELERHDFAGGKSALIAPEKCTGCGVCAEVCRFEAIVSSGETYRVAALACEGCAACYYQCPEEAIRLEERRAGLWFRSDTPFGPLFHAHLYAGQENSGKLVTTVKQSARSMALNTGAKLLLVDGPPGIGCPVISACTGADLALHVVEPTASGIHDLKRILATTDHFGVPSKVVINKADINPMRSDEIASFCETQRVEVVGCIPYDTIVTQAMVQGVPVTAFADGLVTHALREIWQSIRNHGRSSS